MNCYDVNGESIKILLPQYILNLQNEAKALNVNFNADRSFTVIKRYFKYNPSTILRLYDIKMYIAMLSWSLKMYEELKVYGFKVSVFCSVATHIHAFTPPHPYLALTFSFFKDGIEHIKFKLEPYLGENNLFELCHGITVVNANFNIPYLYKRIKASIEHSCYFCYLNISPSTLYSFTLVQRTKTGFYDQNRRDFIKDMTRLQNFFEMLKASYNVDFNYKNGYLLNKIPKVQQLSLMLEKNDVKFPHISCLVEKI